MKVSMFYRISVVVWILVVLESRYFFSRPLTPLNTLGGVFILLVVLGSNQALGVFVTYHNYPQGLQKWKILWGVPGFVGIYMTCVTAGAALAHYFPAN